MPFDLLFLVTVHNSAGHHRPAHGHMFPETHGIVARQRASIQSPDPMSSTPLMVAL